MNRTSTRWPTSHLSRMSTKIGDTLEREHLRDEQVHDVGFDAGAVLQRSGHLVGEACPGLGVAARTVLDLCVGVTHDLLEHDVDEGAPLVACGVGFASSIMADAIHQVCGSRWSKPILDAVGFYRLRRCKMITSQDVRGRHDHRRAERITITAVKHYLPTNVVPKNMPPSTISDFRTAQCLSRICGSPLLPSPSL